MNIQLCIFGILCTLALVQCETDKEKQKNWEECIKETNISEDLLKWKPNFDDPNVKCFSACLMEKEKVLAGGKFVVEKGIELFAARHPGEMTDAIKVDMKECARLANENKNVCDVAGFVDKCFLQKHPPKE